MFDVQGIKKYSLRPPMDPRLIFQRILADRLTRVLSEWGKLDERQINLSMYSSVPSTAAR